MNEGQSHKRCLNCQTELQGEYCHTCGQHASKNMHSVKEFVLEYLNNAFIWDPDFFRTLWSLLRKPGYLTNEYVSGKIVSHMHPLKLNMFLLLTFITIFLLFKSSDDLNKSIHNITRNESTYSALQLDILSNDEYFIQQINESGRDTIQLYAPFYLSEWYPQLITNLESSASPTDYSLGIWKAAVSHALIQEGVLIQHTKGHYYFSEEIKKDMVSVDTMEDIWKEMVDVGTQHFPMIILLTAPILALLLNLFRRKKDNSKFKNVIFSLHYTAFLEASIILLYLIFLIVPLPIWFMQWFLIAGSCLYLTISVRNVYYEDNNWGKAIKMALFTFLSYVLILIVLFFIIFLIACVIVAKQQ